MRRLAMFAVLLAACDKKEEDKPKKASGPEKVKVRHILVSWSGAGTGSTLSFEEAKAKAENLYDRVKKGDDFARIMARESEDNKSPGAGTYWLVNDGIEPENNSEHPRSGPRGMVKAFGDAAFSMNVGDIVLVPYDPKDSPFGWHIIHRME